MKHNSFLVRGTLAAVFLSAPLAAGSALADDVALQAQVKALQNKVDQLEAQQAANQSIPPATPMGMMYNTWDPFMQVEAMQQQMNNMMANMPSFNPRMDIQKTSSQYIITMDLPGMDKNKINVQVKDGVLTVSGDRQSEFEQNKGKNGQFYRQERSFGTFMQAVPLPDDAKTNDINADYKNGVLTVTVGREKKAEKKPEAQKIMVK